MYLSYLLQRPLHMHKYVAGEVGVNFLEIHLASIFISCSSSCKHNWRDPLVDSERSSISTILVEFSGAPVYRHGVAVTLMHLTCMPGIFLVRKMIYKVWTWICLHHKKNISCQCNKIIR